MIDPDDDDGALFDEPDEDVSSDPALAWANSLIIGEPLEGDGALEALEKQYRYEALSHPVMFTHDDEISGIETLENEEMFAKAMKLPPGSRVTLEEAHRWTAENTSPSGAWIGG
jgi:hypothetical protein